MLPAPSKQRSVPPAALTGRPPWKTHSSPSTTSWERTGMKSLGHFLAQVERLQEREAARHPEILRLHQEMAGLLQENHALAELRKQECIDAAFYIAQTNENNKKLEAHRQALGRYRSFCDTHPLLKKSIQLFIGWSKPRPFPDLTAMCFTTWWRKSPLQGTASYFTYGMVWNSQKAGLRDETETLSSLWIQMKEGQTRSPSPGSIPGKRALPKVSGRSLPERAGENRLFTRHSLSGGCPCLEQERCQSSPPGQQICRKRAVPRNPPEEVFQKAAALHTAKAAAYGGRLTPLVRPFRDKLRCGVCGEPCKRDHTRTGEIHWICPHCQTSTVALPDELLVRKVIVLLNKAITHPEIIDIPAPKREAVPINVVRLKRSSTEDERSLYPHVPTAPSSLRPAKA